MADSSKRLLKAKAALRWRERARAGARQRETASEHLLDGPWRRADTHDQRHRYCALDILGKATGLSVGRLIGGAHRRRVQPYCSLLMEEPNLMRKVIEEYREKGFAAFKIGWGPFGRARDSNLDRAIVKAAREAAGPEALRRCRRQRCLLAARPQMGAAHCRDACRLRCRLV